MLDMHLMEELSTLWVVFSESANVQSKNSKLESWCEGPGNIRKKKKKVLDIQKSNTSKS